MAPENYFEVDEVRLWLDPGGGITIKAVTRDGDSVELSSAQARLIASHLEALANVDEA